MKRRILLSVVFAMAAVLVGWLFRDHLRPSGGEGGGLQQVSGRPGLIVHEMNGRGIDLAEQKGRVLIVHFWATWCSPCLEELPALVEFWKRYENRKDIALFAIATDKEGWEKIGPWVQERKISLPVFVDEGGKVAERFGTTMFPETYIVAPDGKVVQRVAEAVDWSKPEVIAWFDELLATPPKS